MIPWKQYFLTIFLHKVAKKYKKPPKEWRNSNPGGHILYF